MRREIFKKASYLLKTNQVKITSETENAISFQVGQYHVKVQYRDHKMIWTCECKSEPFGYLCAHKIAAQNYLTK
jgi:hypothetical protein